MTSRSDGRVYAEVYAPKSGLTARAGSVRISGRIERIWLLPVVDYRDADNKRTASRFG